MQQTIPRHGYSPNFGAQALVAKPTSVIGTTISTKETAIFANGIQVFQETLAQNGITLVIASCSYRPEPGQKQIRSLLAHSADALLLIGQSQSNATYQFLTRRNIPYVLEQANKKDSEHYQIDFDHQSAA